MSARLPPLIVGAGPAGMRAAMALVAAGLRPVVVDEAHACGGQIYRQRLIDDGRSAAALYGSEAGKATRLHRDFAALMPQIDYRPLTSVWAMAPGRAECARDGLSDSIAHEGVILATGATDRILPLPGWTLPGVFTLGGAQIALKAQGCLIGRRVVFVGGGPLLYLVAWQYMKAGAEVVAVLDSAPISAKLALLKALPVAPGVVLRGLGMVADLKRAGVRLENGVEQVAFQGRERVEGVSWERAGKAQQVACDGVGYGMGLRSESQLADLCGCDFAFRERERAFAPVVDEAGRSTVQGVYLAGDGVRIRGADAAEAAGERAALALIEDRGLPVDRARVATLDAELRRQEKLRDALEAAFPFPAHWFGAGGDDTVLCRCEDVSIGDARAAIAAFDLTEINRLKAVTRIGMGRCQGRICAAGAAELLAQANGAALSACGRLRGQAPVKPLPFTALPQGREAAP